MMKTLAAAFLLSATVVFAQQPQPATPRDPAEGAQTPANKNLPGPQSALAVSLATGEVSWRTSLA